MNAVRQFAKWVLASCVGHDRLLVRGPGSTHGKPRLALTFDDGPHPEYTPRLLDRLAKLGLRATFFVIGQNAARHPELVRRMALEGHEVANHTYTHSEPRHTSAERFLDEIRRTDELLSNLTGCIPAAVRPPKGELNLSKLSGVWRQRKIVALWNVDPKDFRMKNFDQICRWCESYEPNDGDIVLLHDNHPYAERAIEMMAASRVFEWFETVTIQQFSRSIQNTNELSATPS